MSHDYLLNVATALYIVCYVPELYANYKNKNANVYNLPEKVIILLGTTFSLLYAIFNENPALISNYGPIFALDLIAFFMRLYYVLQNCRSKSPITTSVMIQTEFSPITITVVSLD
jgi:uncharacterized protein with PQ loop repeat